MKFNSRNGLNKWVQDYGDEERAMSYLLDNAEWIYVHRALDKAKRLEKIMFYFNTMEELDNYLLNNNENIDINDLIEEAEWQFVNHTLDDNEVWDDDSEEYYRVRDKALKEFDKLSLDDKLKLLIV